MPTVITVLRVGLTGGIGSGKSTVAGRLVERGAVLVDSDRIAREVVAPGTAGLAEIRDAFGDEVIGPDGGLDRAAVAARVFGDDAARARLNAIVHPRVRHRSDELVAAAPPGVIVVQDVPLLVEGGMAPRFPIVVVVHADVGERVRRLVEARGMPEADARARIAAQADDAARRAAADVWLDNTGSADDLRAAVDRLWDGRLVPFAGNLDAGRAAPWSPVLVDPDPTWPEQAARVAARVGAAAGGRGRGVVHVGTTAVPGLPAEDVLDLQLGVVAADDADAVRQALADAGFPRRPDIDRDGAATAGAWPERFHASADPGRPVHLHVRMLDSPGWRYALLVRDWLRSDAAARAEYVRFTASYMTPAPVDAVTAEEPWSGGTRRRAEDWAASSGWVPSLDTGGPVNAERDR